MLDQIRVSMSLFESPFRIFVSLDYSTGSFMPIC